MSNHILKDTSLCAIVRDEEDNPAHGVEDWLRATLPHVEQAVVVDTGSIDRTLEILYNLKKEFSHLEIYERQFDDFASSRNFSLEKVKTKSALILDADELLMPEEYKRLGEFVLQSPAQGYDFTFKQIYPDATILNTIIGCQLTRLFNVEGTIFYNSRETGIYEDPALTFDRIYNIPTQIAIIKHFLPEHESLENKKTYWYNCAEFQIKQPKSHAEEFGWKKRNGGRNFYYDTEERLKRFHPYLFTHT